MSPNAALTSFNCEFASAKTSFHGVVGDGMPVHISGSLELESAVRLLEMSEFDTEVSHGCSSMKRSLTTFIQVFRTLHDKIETDRVSGALRRRLSVALMNVADRVYLTNDDIIVTIGRLLMSLRMFDEASDVLKLATKMCVSDIDFELSWSSDACSKVARCVRTRSGDLCVLLAQERIDGRCSCGCQPRTRPTPRT